MDNNMHDAEERVADAYYDLVRNIWVALNEVAKRHHLDLTDDQWTSEEMKRLLSLFEGFK